MQCHACVFCSPVLAVPLISLVTLGGPLSHSCPQFLHLKSTGVVLGDDATEPPTPSPEPPLTSSCPLPDTFPWPPLSSLSKHSSLIGGGPLPSCLSSWLPVKSAGLGPRGLPFLAHFQEQLATGLGGGLSGRVARPLEARTLVRLWPAGLPQARGSPLPVVGRQIPRQSHFHFCTL